MDGTADGNHYDHYGYYGFYHHLCLRYHATEKITTLVYHTQYLQLMNACQQQGYGRKTWMLNLSVNGLVIELVGVACSDAVVGDLDLYY